VSFRPPGPARPPGRPALTLVRWPRLVLPVIAALVVLILIVGIGAGIWTDWLWFSAVHYASVFGTTYGTRWAMFFVAGVFMALVTGANAVLAYRLRPIYRPASTPGAGGDSYRLAIDPHRRLLLGVLLAMIGMISGIAAASAWRTWLLFINQVRFGVQDPQFHLDLSFFVFTYPFIRLVLSFLFWAVLLSLVLAGLVHYLYGGLRMQGRHPRVTVATQAHLFVLFGSFVLLKAAAYWVDRYGIDFSQRGAVTTGASYTDVNAVLPAKTVLAVIAVICALLFFAGAARRSAMLPAVGFGLLVLSAILIGGLYPAIIQQFVVKPNELAKETPYIQREINSTRQAYGITAATVKVQQYSAIAATSDSAQLASEVAGLQGLRLLDPDVVSSTFQQLQQVKSYYQFPSQLAMDRYPMARSALPRDTVIAVRGMGGPPPGQGNWINSHLVYTHGFGVVAATANTVQGNGNPSFVESQIPPTGVLGLRQPRVYFGQQENSYAIVGGPPGGHQEELDYPSDGGQRNNTYQGGGGVAVGSPVNRLLYAIKFRELNILLSGAINSQSKILYDRQPLARVAKVAPFLTLDGETYPVVADGQIYWVVDGYTTTDLYPYSQRTGLAQATSTSDAPGGSVAGQQIGQLNYLRNSVKAVVNAYTGAVTLYAWDPQDPILRTWMRAFPGIIKPKQDIPGYLVPHLRYPPDLFEVQRQVLAQYHVLSAQSFYGGQNFWAVPNQSDQSGTAQFSQPPYYQTMTMPGAQTEFSLTSPLVQRGRQNMAAYLAVDSDPQSTGYGQLRVLQLPQDTAILGPRQVQSTFESDPGISSQLSLYRQNGSKVIEGDLITLPVAGGLIYEEPFYIQAAGTAGSSFSGSYPVLKRIAVSFDGNIGFGPTLQDALSQVIPGFGGSGPGTGTGPSSGSTGQGKVSAAVRNYLAQAESDYAQAQAALKHGDLGSYQKYIAKMKTALDQAQRAAAPHG
jgi:uncharacterized membrane protein (UPF0182 family)